MSIDTFRHEDWTKIWSWKWSFLSCSHFGVEYTDLIRFGGRPFVSQCIIYVQDGKSSCWIRQVDRDILGNYLTSGSALNKQLISNECVHLKKSVDAILNFIDVHIEKSLDEHIISSFFEEIVKYYHPHIFVKYIVDYLESDSLGVHLSELEEARVYAEPVFKRTEDYIENMLSLLAQKSGIEIRLLRCLSYEEILDYLKHQKMIQRDVLENRDKGSFLLFESGKFDILVGEECRIVDEIISSQNTKEEVKGKIAFKGKISGIVRVVSDPFQVNKFDEGDILVTGMTRPDYLPLMKKAGAFVTDSGGMLCHAAIVARELKKPCVIGTKIATKVFKDGDLVEVDANTGIVKKLN